MQFQKIEEFFEEMRGAVSIAKTVREQLAFEIGSDFDVFRFIRCDEIGLSSILADLLDPKGSHGQGGVFLRLFYEECGFPLSDQWKFEGARVTREMIFSNGRMDIVISMGMRIDLVLENKPWANEGYNQMQRYADYLSKKSDGEAKLVFLPGFNADASSISSDTKKLWVINI